MNEHPALDFGCPPGTPILAAHDGVVTMSGYFSEWGNYLRVRRADGLESGYAHLATRGVFVGEQVSAGQRLGQSGNTGKSTGPHLHTEVWLEGTRVDPAPFLGL